MNESLRSRIEKRIRTMGMTQRDFAARLGVSEVTVSRWLSGERNPSIETLGKLADALRTDPSYFFASDGRAEEKKPEPEEKKDDSVNWGAILAGTALSATAVIGIVALAKAMGKLSDKDEEQIKDILNRE